MFWDRSIDRVLYGCWSFCSRICGRNPANSARVKSALEADSFITSSAGRSISDTGDGKLNINYTRSDGDVAFPTFTNISGVVDVTISEATHFLRIPP